MKTLSISNHWREQQQITTTLRFCFQARTQLIAGLCFHRQLTIRTVLSPKPCEQEADEMINLGDRRYRALAAAARITLFDADRGRKSSDEIDVRPRHLFHELPRVRAHRIQETPLTL